METRIERYKLYRQEILNEGLILDKLANESETIKNYKEKIDSIEPKILEGVSSSRSLANLISIDKKNYKDIENIREFSSLIDDQKINTYTKEINEYIDNSDFSSILDENGRISNKWLAEDKNFLNIVDNKSKLENLRNTWKSFQVVSKDQIQQINELIKSKKICEEFSKYGVNPLDESKESSKSYKGIYIGILSLTCVLFTFMVIFLVIKFCI